MELSDLKAQLSWQKRVGPGGVWAALKYTELNLPLLLMAKRTADLSDRGTSKFCIKLKM